MQKVTIFGGSGFIGSYIVKELVKSGCVITIASRYPESASFLKVCANLGQVNTAYCDVLDQNLIEARTKDSDVVINLVGVLMQNGDSTFDSINYQSAKNIAQIAKKNGVKKFIHFSALTDDSTDYGKSKLKGESAVLSAFPDAIIIKPGVVFGEEDRFLNLFAKIVKKFRILPLICKGKAKLQPVYVGDIAKFISALLKEEDIKSKSYNLVGPKKYTLKDLMIFVKKTLDIGCLLLPTPYYLAMAKAYFLEFKIIKPLNKLLTGDSRAILTRDQVRMLCRDNTSEKNDLTELGITPTAIEDVVPKYLKSIN